MSNDVTIKVDSRVLYGLIAVVAVIGIFGVGLWLGGALGGGDEADGTTAAQPVPDAAAQQPVAGASGDQVAAAPTLQMQQPPPQQPQTTGQAPLSPDEVPVEEGQPRIWVPEAAEVNWQYDFGSIPPTDKVEREFIVENVGKGVLEITDASASCGCTAALVEDSTVEPGETTTIRVSYDPRVNQEFGKFVTKQIRIKSNDPLVPLAEFTITADVQAQ